MEVRNLVHALQRFWRERGCVELQPFDGPLHAASAAPAAFLRLFGDEPWFASQCVTVRRPGVMPAPDRRLRTVREHELFVHLKPAPPRALPLVLESLRAAGTPPDDHAVGLVPCEQVDDVLGIRAAGFAVRVDGLDCARVNTVDHAAHAPLGTPSLWVGYRVETLAVLLRLPALHSAAERLGLTVDDLRWQLGWRYGAVFGTADAELTKAYQRLDQRRAHDLVAAALERAERHLAEGARATAFEALAVARYEIEALQRAHWPRALPRDLLARCRSVVSGCVRREDAAAVDQRIAGQFGDRQAPAERAPR